MGTRRMNTMGQLVLGSVSRGVLKCAECPVTIVRGEKEKEKATTIVREENS